MEKKTPTVFFSLKNEFSGGKTPGLLMYEGNFELLREIFCWIFYICNIIPKIANNMVYKVEVQYLCIFS